MTLCTITGWQCHCQPPEIPCDGLKELREAYADWRRKAEQAQRELSLAEEGLANYAQEVEQLKAALSKYGFHTCKCSAGFPISDHCTCGFSDALRKFVLHPRTD